MYIAGLGIEIDSSDAKSASSDLDKIARSSEKAQTSTDKLTSSSRESAAAFDRLKRSIDPTYAASAKYDDGVRVLDRAMDAGAISADQYRIAMQQLEAQLRDMDDGAREAQSGIGRLAKAGFGLVAAYAGFNVVERGIRGVFNAAQDFAGLSNSLRVMGYEGDNLTKTLGNIADMANATRSPLEGMSSLFQKGKMAAAELGASDSKIYAFTEAIGLALGQTAGGAAAAQGALLQLGQALGGGVVRAEEFNSILEGAYPIALAAARGLDRAGGSVAKLRSLIVDGEVSSRQFFDAILSQGDALRGTFEQTIPTISQAMTVLNNKFMEFIGVGDQSLGVTGWIAKSILTVADNLDVLIPSLVGATAAVAVLTAAMLANPVGLIAVGAAAAATGITLLITKADEIKAKLYEWAQSNDVVAAGLWAVNKLIDGWRWQIGNAQKAFNAYKSAIGAGVSFIKDAFASMGIDIGGVMSRLGNAAYNSANFVIGAFVGAKDATTGAFKLMLGVIGTAISGVASAVIQGVEDLANAIITGIERFANKALSPLKAIAGELTGLPFGLGEVASSIADITIAFDGVKFDKPKFGADLMADAMVDLSKAGQALTKDYLGVALGGARLEAQMAGVQSELDRAADSLDGVGSSAEKTIESTEQLTKSLGGGGKKGGLGGAAKDAAKALSDLKNEYQSLRHELFPAERASFEFAEKQQLVNDALKAGIIELPEATEMFEKLKDAQRSAALEANEAAQAFLNAWQSAISTIIDSFAKGDFVGGIKGAFNGLKDAAVGSLKDLFSKALSPGGGGIGGLISGIGGSFKALAGVGKGIVGMLGGTAAGSMTGVLAGLGAALPGIGAVMTAIPAITGLIKGFSKTTKTVTGSGVSLSVSGGDLLGQNYKDIKKVKSSFWGLRKKTSRYTEYSDLSTEQASEFAALMDGIQSQAKGLFAGVGLDISQSAIDGIEMGTQKLDSEEKIQAFFDEYAQKVFALSGGSMEQLSAFASVNPVLEVLGQNLGKFTASAGDMAQALLDLTGGAEAFNQKATGFYNTFASDEAKFEAISSTVKGVFADLGVAIPKTLDGVYALSQSFDLTTEKGRKAYAALLNNQSAIADYIKKINEQETAQANALAQFKKDQSDLLFDLMGDDQKIKTLKDQVIGVLGYIPESAKDFAAIVENANLDNMDSIADQYEALKSIWSHEEKTSQALLDAAEAAKQAQEDAESKIQALYASPLDLDSDRYTNRYEASLAAARERQAKAQEIASSIEESQLTQLHFIRNALENLTNETRKANLGDYIQ